MICLKPQVGLGTVLKDKPKHFPWDQEIFDASDIIFGPMETVSLGSNKLNILKYEEDKTVFEAVKNVDYTH